MEESAEFPRPDASAKEIAEKAAEDAYKNAREVAYPVLDMEGNEWTYRCMVSEAHTIIKFKKEGEKQPAITLIQSKSEEGELGSGVVVISVSNEGIRKKVFYGNDGKIKSMKDIDPRMQKSGVYMYEWLPQKINIRKTVNRFLEGFRLIKGELPTLVSAAGSKPIGVESKPAEPKAVERKPMLRKAA